MKLKPIVLVVTIILLIGVSIALISMKTNTVDQYSLDNTTKYTLTLEDINVVEKTVWIRTKEYKNEFVAFMTYFENAEMDRLNALEKGDKIVLYIDSAWDRHINKDNMFIQIISMNCNGEGILSMVEYNSHLSHLNRRAMVTAVTGISVLLTIIVVLSISLVRNTRDGSVS